MKEKSWKNAGQNKFALWEAQVEVGVAAKFASCALTAKKNFF